MYTVHEMRKQLESAENQPHLILGRLFQIICNRKLRSTEWGILRKLIKLYGPMSVFSAMLSSVHIDGNRAPLNYVSKICKSRSEEEPPEVNITCEETKKLIARITRRDE